jgi:hypothetical protein
MKDDNGFLQDPPDQTDGRSMFFPSFPTFDLRYHTTTTAIFILLLKHIFAITATIPWTAF